MENQIYLKNSCKNHKHNGPSSFRMNNEKTVFEKLDLKEGENFLDLGCGCGDYSFYASEIVKEKGKIFAFDSNIKTIANLNNEIKERKTTNILAEVCDIRKAIPLESKSIDVCLISTVLHIFPELTNEKVLFLELVRILKADGKLHIIECGFSNFSFGPPREMRVSPQDIEMILEKYGFIKSTFIDLGFNYMISFSLKD